jgi:hypothetical protein
MARLLAGRCSIGRLRLARAGLAVRGVGLALPIRWMLGLAGNVRRVRLVAGSLVRRCLRTALVRRGATGCRLGLRGRVRARRLGLVCGRGGLATVTAALSRIRVAEILPLQKTSQHRHLVYVKYNVPNRRAAFHQTDPTRRP